MEQPKCSTGQHINQGVPPPAGSYLDLAFIRRNIPITDVARELDVEVFGSRARCWRPENHQNGDRTPSVGFQRRTNRGRCWVCDDRSWSVIDLVMMVLDCDFPAAVAWVSDHFAVPAAAPGKHLTPRQSWNPRYRVGCSRSTLEWLVRAGVWADLPASHRSILVVLDTFTDSDTGQAMISYRGLMRYSGVRTKMTVRRALQHFVRIGLLEIEHGVGAGGFRSVSRYRLMFDSPQFLGLVNEIHRHQQKEIELDRAFRAEERKRQRSLCATAEEVPLSTHDTRGNSHGLHGVDPEV